MFRVTAEPPGHTGNFVYKDPTDVNQPNGTEDSSRWDIPNTATSQIT